MTTTLPRTTTAALLLGLRLNRQLGITSGTTTDAAFTAASMVPSGTGGSTALTKDGRSQKPGSRFAGSAHELARQIQAAQR